MARKTPTPHFTGWQAERREALALLEMMREQALRRRQFDRASALLWAAWDVRHELRTRAVACIEEGTRMQWAHELLPVAA